MTHYTSSISYLRTHARTQVMLESFLQAQKVSVRKTLQRSFRRYVTYGEENNQLIMHQLQNLIMEVEKYKMVRTSILMKEYYFNLVLLLYVFFYYLCAFKIMTMKYVGKSFLFLFIFFPCFSVFVLFVFMHFYGSALFHFFCLHVKSNVTLN